MQTTDMPLLMVVIAGATLLALWWCLDPPRPGFETLICIDHGQAALKRGQVRPPVLADVRALVSDARIGKGWIGITNRRVAFSRSIPIALRQKLRNVTLNG